MYSGHDGRAEVQRPLCDRRRRREGHQGLLMVKANTENKCYARIVPI